MQTIFHPLDDRSASLTRKIRYMIVLIILAATIQKAAGYW